MATYSDIGNEFFTNSATKDLVLKTDELAVRQSIRNLVNLEFGSKPFHPEILINIKGILFENLTPFLVTTTKRNLTEILQTYEPRAEIVDVLFADYVDDGAVIITIVFKIINTNKEQKLDLYFDRVR